MSAGAIENFDPWTCCDGRHPRRRGRAGGWASQTLAIIGCDCRMIQSTPVAVAVSILVVLRAPSPGHTTPAARVSPIPFIARGAIRCGAVAQTGVTVAEQSAALPVHGWT
jgi:hypothetical protein